METKEQLVNNIKEWMACKIIKKAKLNPQL